MTHNDALPANAANTPAPLYWLGVDTGGTFTDFVLLGQGVPRIHKTLSTPAAPEQAILAGVRALGMEAAMQQGQLAIVHGTTVATNAALEEKGAQTLLVTNAGLEDVLRIGRQQRPALYDLTPTPVTTALAATPAVGVACRVGAQGEVVSPLSESDITALLEGVSAHKPESIALCLVFSYLHPEHEQRLAQALRDAGYPVSVSHEVLPTQGEVERGTATWLNAWLLPKVADYLTRLSTATAPSPLAIMQSHGGTIAASAAAEQAVNLLLSGPAGGLAAVARLGEQLNMPKLMTFDMGGTSTDVALLDGGIQLTQQGRIGPYPVAVPMVDMHTIGAGGGSLASVDEAGLLHVGPQSAGADPGPACYGRGGQQATVTDANVLLGRLQPAFALGGELSLDTAAAQQALSSLAEVLGLSAQEAAEGVVALANEHMTQALRVISIQQGHDPADFALVSFGGAGGLHVCALADNLSMARAIVPERAGVLSAEGLVFAPRKRERLCALPVDVSLDALLQLVADLKQQGQAALVAEGVDAQDVQYRVMLDMCYRGQSSVVSVPWQEGQPLADSMAAFHQRHEQRFGHRLALPVQHVNVRVACHVDGQQLTLPNRHPEPCDPERWVTLPNITSPVAVYRRDTLGAHQRLVGPALIYEAVGTVWLAQGWYATVHPQGHLLLDKGEQ